MKAESSKSDSKRQHRARSLDRSKRHDFSNSVRNSRTKKRNTEDFDEHHQEPKERGELPDSPTKDEDLMLEIKRRSVEHVRRHHVGTGQRQPATRRGAWNSVSNRVIEIAALANEFPKTRSYRRRGRVAVVMTR